MSAFASMPKTLPKKDLLQSAVSKCELYPVNDNQGASKVQSTEQYKCGCEKIFLSQGGYYRHIKNCKQRPGQQVVTGKTKCNEPGCLLTFKYIRDFRQHLYEKHQIQFDVENKHFETYSDFLHWKIHYESETRSCFCHRKNLKSSGRRVEYWYCNRSGRYQNALQSRKRKVKSQRILKINNNCTSTITLTVNEIDDIYQAIIYHTHYGHEAELVHLPISKSDEQAIASKLLQGVNIGDILSSYKENGPSKQTEQKHLIKRKDILNISKKYNVIILPKVQPSKYKTKQDRKKIKRKDSLTNLIETNKRHFIASQLALSFVSPICENVWRISMENSSVSTHYLYNNNKNVYDVTKNDVVCFSDDCLPHCNYCNICYHAYSCTCPDSKKIICEHVHLAVLFQENPQPQNEVHIERCLFEIQDHTKYTKKCPATINSQPIKNVKSEDNDTYKPNMNAENLKNVKMRMEKLMMDTLQEIYECNNSELLENMEKQITNLSRDLSGNTTKKKIGKQTMSPEKNIEV